VSNRFFKAVSRTAGEPDGPRPPLSPRAADLLRGNAGTIKEIPDHPFPPSEMKPGQTAGETGFGRTSKLGTVRKRRLFLEKEPKNDKIEFLRSRRI